jgi:hypothetical protein
MIGCGSSSGSRRPALLSLAVVKNGFRQSRPLDVVVDVASRRRCSRLGWGSDLRRSCLGLRSTLKRRWKIVQRRLAGIRTGRARLGRLKGADDLQAKGNKWIEALTRVGLRGERQKRRTAFIFILLWFMELLSYLGIAGHEQVFYRCDTGQVRQVSEV